MSVAAVLIFGWVLFVAVYLSLQAGRGQGRIEARIEALQRVERDLAPMLREELLRYEQDEVFRQHVEAVRKAATWN